LRITKRVNKMIEALLKEMEARAINKPNTVDTFTLIAALRKAIEQRDFYCAEASEAGIVQPIYCLDKNNAELARILRGEL